MLSFLGIVLMVGLTGIGSSIGVTICGNAAVGAMKKNPDALGQYIGLSALPSSQGLYGEPDILPEGIRVLTLRSVRLRSVLTGSRLSGMVRTSSALRWSWPSSLSFTRSLPSW